jgi:hypothetical protein
MMTPSGTRTVRIIRMILPNTVLLVPGILLYTYEYESESFEKRNSAVIQETGRGTLLARARLTTSLAGEIILKTNFHTARLRSWQIEYN